MSSDNSRKLTPSGVCRPTQPNRYAPHMPPSQREFDCVEEQRPRELDKSQHIGLNFEWDNGERLDPNISCHLTIGGKTTIHRLADGKNLFCPAPAGEYVAQLLKDVDTKKNLDEAREQLAKALAEIIVHEKKEAAALKKVQDGRNFVNNYAHLYYKQARGFALTGWRFSKNLKEWNDLINPFNQFSNALISAWNAKSTDGTSWTKSLIQNYSKKQKDELIQALGFDPEQIDIEQLAEAYEYACFIYNDSPSKILIGKFLLEYVMAQNPEEVAEFSGAVLFEVVLGAILVYLTGGVGLVFRAAQAVTANLLALLQKVGEILIKIANLIKSATIKSASLVRGFAGKAVKTVRIARPKEIIPDEIPLPKPLTVPGRVQSRINLMAGDKSAGWTHVVKRHFDPKVNASQFTVSQNELRTILQSKETVSTPITKILQSQRGPLYVREIHFKQNIGIDKFTETSTPTMTVLTDNFGNLITATPGRII